MWPNSSECIRAPFVAKILKMDSAHIHTPNSSIFFCRWISIGKAKSFTWFWSFERNAVCIDEGCGLAKCTEFQRKFINSFLWFRNAFPAHTPSLFLQFNHRFYLCNPCNVRICECMRNADASFDVISNVIMQPDALTSYSLYGLFFLLLFLLLNEALSHQPTICSNTICMRQP